MPDIQLTDEVKKKLKDAGVLPYQLKNTWKYVPRAYREKEGEDYLIPKEHWPVFTLRCIDGVSASLLEDKQNTKIQYDTEGNRTMSFNSGRVRLEICSLGIIDVKNYRDADGNEIKPKKDETTGGITQDSLKPIPATLQIELANVIEQQQLLTADELQGLE